MHLALRSLVQHFESSQAGGGQQRNGAKHDGDDLALLSTCSAFPIRADRKLSVENSRHFSR
jgi:hypothetical protein